MKSYMKIALGEAKKALFKDEVPIGAVIVDKGGLIIAKSGNKNRELNDPTAHAEILAIRKACKKIKNNNLLGYSIYVTLQPCEMCFHAIINSRITNLYYGASDMENEELQIKYKSFAENKNLKIDIYPSINEKKCSDLLINFFKSKRTK